MEISAELFLEICEGARFEQETREDDRRSAERVQIYLEASVLRLVRGPQAKPIAAIVRDLSVRGVGFECRGEAFHVDESFALRFMRRDGTPVWIQGMVTRWTPIDQHLIAVGGKFTKLLTNSKSADAPEQQARTSAA